MKSIHRLLTVILAAALSVAFTGCKLKSTGKSVLTTTVAGRDVRATVEGSGSIQSQGESAIISFPGHKVTVERERLLLDDTELAKIPAAAKKVEVEYAGGELTVTADGAALATKQLVK